MNQYNDRLIRIDDDDVSYSTHTTTDSSYSDSDSIDDFDEDDELVLYEPEEQCPTRFTLAICIINKTASYPNNEYFHMVVARFKCLKCDYIEHCRYNYAYGDETQSRLFRRMFPRLSKYYNSPAFLRAELIETFYLPPDNYCVAVIKTIWLRLVQRTWRNVLAKRKEVIRLRCMLSSLKHLENKGRWPHSCSTMPTLRGMLAPLKQST